MVSKMVIFLLDVGLKASMIIFFYLFFGAIAGWLRG